MALMKNQNRPKSLKNKEADFQHKHIQDSVVGTLGNPYNKQF